MSSKRRLRRRSCEGKIRHTSKENARAAIRSMSHNKIYGGQWPYKCQFCKGWHVGRPDKKRKKGMRAKGKW